MASNRRDFLTTAILGGMATALPAAAQMKNSRGTKDPKEGIPAIYAKLDAAAKKPVFKKELFSMSVIRIL